ncbi:unnamed protein product [marine sediment metagenome]|uniref:HTH luxR-type domain-containing protein n=1 Tax=marine sediment metagenome TaxID=412755 RepID=X0WDN5_9ZZZZ
MEEREPSPDVLSRREREVVALLSRGLRVRAVAETLCLAPRTIDATRQSAYDKLGIHDRVRLALWAHRHGLDTEPPVIRKPSLPKPDGG